MAAAEATSTAPVISPRGRDLAADEIPVGSPAGSQARAERFNVGSPAPTVVDQDKKVKELEEKVTQLEATIQELFQRQDPWQQRKAVEEPGGGEAAVFCKELNNNEDELKPLHPKDSKPPPEFSGARKDFMVWHETFTSMLKLRSPK